MSQRFVNCSEPLRKNKNNNNHLDLKRRKIKNIQGERRTVFERKALKNGEGENTL